MKLNNERRNYWHENQVRNGLTNYMNFERDLETFMPYSYGDLLQGCMLENVSSCEDGLAKEETENKYSFIPALKKNRTERNKRWNQVCHKAGVYNIPSLKNNNKTEHSRSISVIVVQSIQSCPTPCDLMDCRLPCPSPSLRAHSNSCSKFFHWVVVQPSRPPLSIFVLSF